ncbi:MAG: ribonuclease D [Longimicrobiaceae bacterium]
METPYRYVDDDDQLAELAAELGSEPLLGADTEAAGYHRYRDTVALLQLSTPEKTVLVDPLAVSGLAPLGPLFARPGSEIIFHDADYDLRLLDRDAGITVSNLFDTQVAAAFLGSRRLGLDAVLKEFLGLSIPKKFQRADWAERPLSREMKAYAATDTAHLPTLRNRLRDRLEQRGRLSWAEQEFALRARTRWSGEKDGPAYLRLKGARDLPPRGLAVLREVYAWREGVAESLDRAPFRVTSNDALLALAATPPRTPPALRSLRAVPGRLAEERSSEILAAVGRALEVPENELPGFPRGPRRERNPEGEAAVERMRRARGERAGELGLDPGFLISRAVLAEVAARGPSTPDELTEVPGVRRWQVEAAGAALLGALKG